MKTFAKFMTVFLCLFGLCQGMEDRIAGNFRGVFTQGKTKYAVSIFHDVPKDLKKIERVRYHIKLEQGCQVYEGKTLYTPGRILILAESIYIVEGSGNVGIEHFDLLQLQCDLDANGIITKVRLILPDGDIHEMNHDASTAISQEDNAAEQAGAGQPATRPESKSEGSDKPQPEPAGRSR